MKPVCVTLLAIATLAAIIVEPTPWWCLLALCVLAGVLVGNVAAVVARWIDRPERPSNIIPLDRHRRSVIEPTRNRECQQRGQR